MKTLDGVNKAAQIVRAVAHTSAARGEAMDLLCLCAREYLETVKPSMLMPVKNDVHALLQACRDVAQERNKRLQTKATARDLVIANVVRYVLRQDAIEHRYRSLAASNEPMAVEAYTVEIKAS